MTEVFQGDGGVKGNPHGEGILIDVKPWVMVWIDESFLHFFVPRKTNDPGTFWR